MRLIKLDKLVSKGQPKFGIFDRVENINYLDYHSYKLSGKAASQWQKKLRSNQFCFIQVIQYPYRVSVAVATLNWVTTSFCYIYDIETNKLKIVEGLQPLTRNSQFNQSTYTDNISFVSKKLNIDIIFTQDSMLLNIKSNILNLSANMSRPYSPLAVCSPTGKTGWTYTQKESISEISGVLTPLVFSQHKNDISLTGATASLDWSIGYMRRVTNWWWACISDYLCDGRHFGLNLATGVNETGVSENACWIEGRRYHLPAVLFSRVKNTEDKEIWQIYNQALNWSNVKIELTFTPIHCYNKKDRLLLVDSIFEQWIGYYSGTIDLGDGELVILQKTMGLAEDHYAKW